jgi:hypothetical protein
MRARDHVTLFGRCRVEHRGQGSRQVGLDTPRRYQSFSPVFVVSVTSKRVAPTLAKLSIIARAARGNLGVAIGGDFGECLDCHVTEITRLRRT